MQTTISQNVKKHFTYADYYAIEDDKRYEVLEGELMMVPAPNIKHQSVSGKIERILGDFIFGNDLGQIFHAPTDVVLADDIVVQPDILFVSKERANIIGEQAIMGQPDLIIEILSPSSSFNDSVRKRELYQRSRVREYWLVFPDEKAIEVLTLENDVYREFSAAKGEGKVKSKVIEGVEVDIKEVF